MHHLCGKNWATALKIVDDLGVACYVAQPSGRRVYRVRLGWLGFTVSSLVAVQLSTFVGEAEVHACTVRDSSTLGPVEQLSKVTINGSVPGG